MLGIVSDTHGHVPKAMQAVRMLASLEVDLVVHCGDIGSAEIVDLFSPWPTHFVFGNVDHDEAELRRAILAAGQTCHGRFGKLEIEGRKIAFLHGDDGALLRQTIDAGKWDLVCHGHTHVSRCERRGKTLALNPGALFRAKTHSIAHVDLSAMQATIIPLDG